MIINHALIHSLPGVRLFEIHFAGRLFLGCGKPGGTQAFAFGVVVFEGHYFVKRCEVGHAQFILEVSRQTTGHEHSVMLLSHGPNLLKGRVQ